MDIAANKANAIAFMNEFSSGNREAAWRRTTDDLTWTMNQHSIPDGKLAVFNRKSYDAMVASSGDMTPLISTGSPETCCTNSMSDSSWLRSSGGILLSSPSFIRRSTAI